VLRAPACRSAPHPMDAKQLLTLTFQVAIVATVFGYGLKSTRDDLLYLMRRPGLLLRSLLAVLVVMPILAVMLVKAFDFRQTVEVVLVALAISPVPPLLPQKESKAGGRRSYGLGLMLFLGLVAIAVIPLVVELLQHVFSRSFTADTGAIARIVLIAVLLPLVAGMAVRKWLPRFAERLEKPMHIAANGLLILGVLVLLAVSWQAVWAAAGDGTLLALIAFVAAGLLVGHWMGAPEPQHSVVLALSTACRHPAIALAIAAANFPDQRFGGTILLYLLVSAAVGFPYVAWQRRRLLPAASV
jgi:BASS family bile acid:Na+ symporter